MNLDNEKVINCLSKVKNMIEALINTEKNILLFIQEVIRSSIMTPFFIVVTKLGNGGTIWIAIAVMLLFSKKKRRYGYMIMLSLLGSLLLNNLLLKNLVGRMRPYEIIGKLIHMAKCFRLILIRNLRNIPISRGILVPHGRINRKSLKIFRHQSSLPQTA